MAREERRFWNYRLEIVDAATKHGLPTMTDGAEMVREAGALNGYASTRAERDRTRRLHRPHPSRCKTR